MWQEEEAMSIEYLEEEKKCSDKPFLYLYKSILTSRQQYRVMTGLITSMWMNI